MKIVIADDYQNCVRSLDCFAMLKDHDVTHCVEPAASEAELVARFADAEVLVVVRERIRITDWLLDALLADALEPVENLEVEVAA